MLGGMIVGTFLLCFVLTPLILRETRRTSSRRRRTGARTPTACTPTTASTPPTNKVTGTLWLGREGSRPREGKGALWEALTAAQRDPGLRV